MVLASKDAFHARNCLFLHPPLPFLLPPAIEPVMSKNSAKIIEQFSRGRTVVRDRSRAFTSLLLLGLTRGCRVL
ncbi:hypothetical protein DFI02_102609 [Rhizobium sp. PP-F2F-G20b]|nr:hypothetical protein DFI02_102609 [Rhizobium sp. PP-F2F-G20b]